MRAKDEQKIEAIFRAKLSLTQQMGFGVITMARITPVPGDVIALSKAANRNCWKAPELLEVALTEQGVQ